MSWTIHFTVTAEGNDDDLAYELSQLEHAEKQIKEAKDEITQQLHERLGVGQYDFAAGRVEIRQGKNRTQWDCDSLLSTLRTNRMVNTATGEPEDTLDAVLACWNLGAPRVTALRARNIDPDEYAATSPGRVSVRFA